jgi:hypothetical protein
VSDEVDQDRALGFAAALAFGVPPEEIHPSLADGPTAAERLLASATVESAVRTLRRSGVLGTTPASRSVMDVTPSEVHRLGRKVDALRALRSYLPQWQDPAPLGELLRQVDADRRADVLARLRQAGFDVPPEDDLWPLENR